MSKDGPVVIVGGGVVGLSTAYFLLQQRSGDGSGITIVDNAPELLLGASGAANGGQLCPWNQSGPTTSFQQWSAQVQQSLSEQHDGYRRWQFRSMNTLNLMHRADEKSLPAEEAKHLRPVPAWIPNNKQYIGILPQTMRNAAQVHFSPRRLCEFLLDYCRTAGISVLCNTTAIDAQPEDGTIKAVKLQTGSSSSFIQPCEHLVVTAGAWTFRVLQSLFPSTSIKGPAGPISYKHWLNVKDPYWQSEWTSDVASQVLFQEINEFPLNLTNYSDGTLFASNWSRNIEGVKKSQILEDQKILPDGVTDVEMDPTFMSILRTEVAKALEVNDVEDLEITREGCSAYYVFPDHRVILTVVDAQLLWPGLPSGRSGVYLAPSQMNGAADGPAMGKLLSELVSSLPLSLNMDQFTLAAREL